MSKSDRLLAAWLTAVAFLLGASADAPASQRVVMQVDTLSVVEKVVTPKVSGEGPWRIYGGLPGVEAGVETRDGSHWFVAEDRALRLQDQTWTEYATAGDKGLVDGLLLSAVESQGEGLWFAGHHDSTASALRFDGKTWIRYSHPDDIQKPGTSGHGAAVDNRNRLWMTAEHFPDAAESARRDSSWGGEGVLRFDGDNWVRFTVADGLVHNLAHDIDADAFGQVAIGGYWGASLYDGDGFRSHRLDYKGHDVAMTGDGDIWVNHGFYGGGITILRDGVTDYVDVAKGLPVQVLRRLEAAPGGRVWVGTALDHFELFGSRGVLYGDGESWLRISHPEGLPGASAFPIIASSEGTVWLSVSGIGLVSYKPDFSRTGSLSGRVTRAADGTPWKDAGVYALGDSGSVRAGARVGSDGQFRMKVFPGTYIVEVAFSEGAGSDTVVVKAGETVEGLMFSPTSITPPPPPSIPPPDWFIWLIGAIMLSLVAIAVGASVWFWRRRRKAKRARESGEPVDLTSADRPYPGIRQAIWLLVKLAVLASLLGAPVMAVNLASGSSPTSNLALVACANLLAFWLILRSALKRARLSWREALSLAPVGGSLLLSTAITTVGASILLSELGNLVQVVLPTPDMIAELFRGMAGAEGELWGSLLLIVIVAPLTEEILFRGVILRGFLKYYSVRKAILVSSLLFGLFHLNPWQAVPATLLGALFGWWYVRTRSLLPCIFGHALNNAIPLLLVGVIGVEFEGFSSDPSAELVFQPLWLNLVGLVMAGGGIWWLTRAFEKGHFTQA